MTPGRTVSAAAFLSAFLFACGAPPPPSYHGYVEGEFVNVAASYGGRLDKLAVQRGDGVGAGTPLYALDAVSEAAAEREAAQRLAAAEAQLADLRLGRRAPELAVTKAQIRQAEVDLERTTIQLARDEAQLRAGGIPQAQLDDARTAHAAAEARLAQLRSELAVGELPGRADQITAQVSQVAAARAALDQAAWRLGQKTVAATREGRVYDTLYRAGEWVPAGAPVVRMLPPGNLKLRFFVPQEIVGGLAAGRPVVVRCDGCGDDIAATLSYVSNQAEFTPPIIFSNERRSKLVFMVEAKPDSAADAKRLNPGQPVSVALK